jgi:phosphatidylglycerol:prolipoprotein diacylglycerol transferase
MGIYSNAIRFGKLMNPILVHIWGPFSIHAYGFLIALGACVAVLLAKHDQRLKQIISFQDFLTAVQLIVVFGYLGGRILCLLSETWEGNDELWSIFKFWEPGLSIQGAIIGSGIALFCFVKIKKIRFLSFIDRIAIYAPLVQSFGRLGCFFAGCCYGQKTDLAWAITYTHPEHMAPLSIPLHPTQLYSSLLLFLTFLLLFFYVQKKQLRAGTIFFLYLILVSAERFIIDFFRWDQTWAAGKGIISVFSINQWISLAIIIFGLVGISRLYCFTKSKKQ